MTPFLKQVAQYIFDEHKDQLSKLCIILPSKRGAVFLKKHLHEVFQTTIWMPHILSIDEFVAEVSQINIIDSLNGLIELYPFYQEHITNATALFELNETKVSENTTNSFDQYLRKAITLLQDFNEIDRHLVDDKAIFANLRDIKYLENWSLNQNELSTYQKNYVAIFDAISKIYQAFKSHLLSQNMAYQGLAYRIAVENFKSEKWTVNDKHYLFCGFNAFNKAESTIISGLSEQKKATVLWDSDSYYIKNEIQEAGFFLRAAKQSKQFGKTFLFENEHLSKDQKVIEIVGCPNNMAQTQVIQATLEKWNKANLLSDQTAVIMADEALLMPVLYAIPKNIDKLNVTLGYEIKHAVIYDLFIKWLDLLDYAQTNKQRLYFKDINKILSHVAIQKYFNSSEQKIMLRKLQQNLIKYNIIFTSFKRLNGFIAPEIEFVARFFEPIDDPNLFIEKAFELISAFRENFYSNQENQRFNIIEEQVLFELFKILNQLKTLLPKIKQRLSIKDLKSIFQQLVATSAIDFKGEPLSGLQVMGVLESRTLDFENVILVSVNEGVLPSGKGGNSYIPFDLKLHFELPVHHNKDAIYAYHFWHTIQRSKNICILYNTEGDDLQKGEKSRFITQLETELSQYNKQIELKHYIHSPLNHLKSYAIPLKIESNITIQQQLIDRFKLQTEKENQTGLSPSSINTYLNCSLKFYYQYVLKLKETEEQEETIQANTFGTIVHQALEILYQPFVGKVLKPDHLKTIKSQADETVESAFKIQFDEEDASSTSYKKGKNLLALVSIKKYVHQFIAFDLDRILTLEKENKYISLLGLEITIQKELSYKTNQKEETLLCSGKIDRLEQIGQELIIIDFKSNLGAKTQLKIENVEDAFSTEKPKDKAMQLLFYQWLLHHHPLGLGKQMSPNILSIRSIKQGFHGLDLKMDENQKSNLILDYNNLLNQLILQIFNSNGVFKGTDKLKTCEWCAFRKICYRD